MSEIIDLNERRNAAERPDPEFVCKDEYGREMYTFTLSYDLDGATFGVHIWAYDAEDATKRVAAMRDSLRCDGQIYCVIPA